MGKIYTKSEILAHIDHTLLKPMATDDDYRRLCEEGAKGGVASICVPPAWVKFCDRQLRRLTMRERALRTGGVNSRAGSSAAVKVCTVVGFPLGYNAAEVKAWEANQAILEGADEIDMVVNIGMVCSESSLDGYWMNVVHDEIHRVREVCADRAKLKVITENCYLNEAQKMNLCWIVTDAGADYIKTSTGFGPGGATLEDVKLFREHIGPNVKIKAAGGIATIEDTLRFLEAGADRIGSSKVVPLLLADERMEFSLD